MPDLPEDRKTNPEPEELARLHAKRPLPARFYQEASVCRKAGETFAVQLDGKSVRTPAGQVLALPTEAAAQLIADEFAAQVQRVDPATMPVTRLANSAIDGVAVRQDEVIADILLFAGTDLLCYRAEGPDRLCAMQDAAWNPVLRWAEEDLGASFRLAAGVIHVQQPEEALVAFSTVLLRHASPMSLAAIHSMTSLTGSALLALAVAEGAISAKAAWAAAHVDEDWNIMQWGEDAEATRRRQLRERDMMAAASLLMAVERSEQGR